MAINEAVEQAYADGILTSASLMVAGAAAADAVARARRLPGLRVGLHLVVIEGPAVLPRHEIPHLIGVEGGFPSGQLSIGLRYSFDARTRRELRAEIAAQFAVFAATGLRLDHADAHKHMHLHPTVGAMMIEEGLRHGLGTIRIPAEPPAIMRQLGTRASWGSWAMYQWTRLLRRQARRAGLQTNDHLFGLAWTGHMTANRVCALAPYLPNGRSELYFHPATGTDPLIQRLMPTYQHSGELAALLDPNVAAALGLTIGKRQR